MKLISWNMHQRPGNWAVLAELMEEHDASGAMVQEAVAPPSNILDRSQVFGDPSLLDNPWRLPVPTGAKRNFASGVTARIDAPIQQWVPTPIGQSAYGAPTISHPGQWVAVGIGDPKERIWVVSLYGVWDKMLDSGDIFAEASLHRAISDLTWLFQAKETKRLVLAGDLNIWRDYGKKKWEPRYRTVFDRLKTYGLDLAGPHRRVGPPLEGCPCRAGCDCSHVRTYRHMNKKDSLPYQLDFVFTRGVQVTGCVALDDESNWTHSDHCPILIEVVGL